MNWFITLYTLPYFLKTFHSTGAYNVMFARSHNINSDSSKVQTSAKVQATLQLKRIMILSWLDLKFEVGLKFK